MLLYREVRGNIDVLSNSDSHWILHYTHSMLSIWKHTVLILTFKTSSPPHAFSNTFPSIVCGIQACTVCSVSLVCRRWSGRFELLSKPRSSWIMISVWVGTGYVASFSLKFNHSLTCCKKNKLLHLLHIPSILDCSVDIHDFGHFHDLRLSSCNVFLSYLSVVTDIPVKSRATAPRMCWAGCTADKTWG